MGRALRVSERESVATTKAAAWPERRTWQALDLRTHVELKFDALGVKECLETIFNALGVRYV